MAESVTQASHVSEDTIVVANGESTLASPDHLRRLQSVTDAALANLGVEDLLDELLIRVRDALETDTAAILLMDKAKGELVARAAKGLEEEVEQRVRIPLGRGFAGTIAATRQPMTIFDVDHSIVLNPILREKGIHSLLGVPLIVQGETLGIMHVGTLTPRRFTAEDTALLQLVGDRVALAIHAGLYERERTVARMLQRSFLPETLPHPPGMRLSARYLPAPGGEIGGDWYDAFILPTGSVAIAIGDVVGHGLSAASAMGRLRNALRAYAMECRSPGEVLHRLDRLVQHLDQDDMATVLYGIVDPVDLTFRFASAGHLPPILREPDGSARIANVQSGVPLGVGVGGSTGESVERLRPGTAVVLCTDGLVERRHESLDVGLDRLRDACRSDLEPEGLCERILERLVKERAIDDDVALLILELAPDHGHEWKISLPAEASKLAVLRRGLGRWLAERGVEGKMAYDVLAASGEAAANAIEHAYGPSGGVIHVAAERASDGIVVTVLDFGRWRPPRSTERGRGLPMMQGFADSVEISRTDQGTSVRLRWNLGSRA